MFYLHFLSKRNLTEWEKSCNKYIFEITLVVKVKKQLYGAKEKP